MNNLMMIQNNSKLVPCRKKHIKLKKIKDNTINSLNEVECFLNRVHTFSDIIKLYKILK